MVPHITAVCKSAFFHLRNISKIRGFLNTETTNTPIHASVTSKVDYCNSLMYDVPKYLFQRLQRVLNGAARKVFKSNKYVRDVTLATQPSEVFDRALVPFRPSVIRIISSIIRLFVKRNPAHFVRVKDEEHSCFIYLFWNICIHC